MAIDRIITLFMLALSAASAIIIGMHLVMAWKNKQFTKAEGSMAAAWVYFVCMLGYTIYRTILEAPTWF